MKLTKTIPHPSAPFIKVGSSYFFYFALNLKTITAMATRITQPLIIIGIIGTIVLFEATRRVVGPPILCVASLFLVYAFVGAEMSLRSVVYNLFYTTTGILDTLPSVVGTALAALAIVWQYVLLARKESTASV